MSPGGLVVMTMKVHFEKALAALELLMDENATRAQTAVNSAVRAMEHGRYIACGCRDAGRFRDEHSR